MNTPPEIEKHAKDFNNDAWKQYTDDELFYWVHLLLKRATMRTPGTKRVKDVYDAGNYLAMYKSYADSLPVDSGHRQSASSRIQLLEERYNQLKG